MHLDLVSQMRPHLGAMATKERIKNYRETGKQPIS